MPQILFQTHFKYIWQMMIDLRSDTVTRPSAQMLEAMMKASVGDDVFQEDPSVNELENFVASMFGMEKALFCPSGTMTNQIAIKCHTQPGNEVICDENAHVYIYEGGGIAFNSGCQVKLIKGDRGRIAAHDIKEAINPEDVHRPASTLVCIENTANRGGGSIYKGDEIDAIAALCRSNDINLHLDGARLWNALIATGQSAQWFGERFDSISVCLSKGLGAPVGSLLIGKNSFIKKARRFRKVMGGGMRQAGMLAAAGKFAIENNLNRISIDHKNAKQVAAVLATLPYIGKILPVETNILIFEVQQRFSPQTFVDELKKWNVLCLPVSSTQVRMVFHLDITDDMMEKLVKCLPEL